MFGKHITVAYDKRDRYGRIVGTVLINGQDVNLEHLRTGVAWHYTYCQSKQPGADRQAYAAAEINARKGA